MLTAKGEPEITAPLPDEDGHLINRDADKVESFHSFFTSVFNTDDTL